MTTDPTDVDSEASLWEPAARRSPQTRLRCEVCGGAIGQRREAYATVDSDAIATRAQAMQRWRAQPDVGGDRMTPKLVRWQLMHAECDPHPEIHWHRVPASSMLSERQLLYRVMSLAQRPWMQHTDIRRMARKMLDDGE